MSYYFDHNSCTPVDPRVLNRFNEVEASCPGNPGSLHGQGRRARGIVEESRYEIAQLLEVDVDSVFFVSGGTEANNLIVLGTGNTTLPVLCAPLEHPSVLESAAQRGVVSWCVDSEGTAIVVDPEVPVGLIALVHGQNEVGTMQPVDAAHELAQKIGVPLHIDASQTLGRCPIDQIVAIATSVTFSTHKAGGLRGMGILVDKSHDTQPRFYGGAQQRGRRPGTESPSLAAATALTVALAITEQSERAAAMRDARDALARQLDIDGVHKLTPAHSLPNTIMLRFDGVDGRELLPALDVAGVEASQGSACSSGSPTPPPILTAMGLDEHAAQSCVRFSFSAAISNEEAAQGGRLVKSVVDGMRAR